MRDKKTGVWNADRRQWKFCKAARLEGVQWINITLRKITLKTLHFSVKI